MAGITISVSIVEEIMPPTICAAMRRMIFEPVPLPSRMAQALIMLVTINTQLSLQVISDNTFSFFQLQGC